MAYLNVEVLKRRWVSPQQLHRVFGEEADTEEAPHPLVVGPLHHLGGAVAGEAATSTLAALRALGAPPQGFGLSSGSSSGPSARPSGGSH